MMNTNPTLPDMSPPVTWDTLDATTFIWRAPSPKTCEDILRLFLRHPHSHFQRCEVQRMLTHSKTRREYLAARIAIFDTLNWLAVNTSQLSVTGHCYSFGRAGAPMPTNAVGTPDSPLRVLQGIPTAAEVLSALPVERRDAFTWPAIETALGRRFGRAERAALEPWICTRNAMSYAEELEFFYLTPDE